MAKKKKKIKVGNLLKKAEGASLQKIKIGKIIGFLALFLIIYTCITGGEPCSDERREVQWQTHRYGDFSGATSRDTFKAVKVLFQCMDRNADYYRSHPDEANAACAKSGGPCYADNGDMFQPLTIIGGPLEWNNGNWHIN